MITTNHWASELQPGDRVLATIRHQTNGELNRHNISVVVVDIFEKSILGYDGIGVYDIPFNELKTIHPLQSPSVAQAKNS